MKNDIKFIEGGVTAAKGFTAGGIHAGIRKNKTKPDLAMVLAEVRCNAAAVYTKNLVKSAPLLVTQAHLKDGKAQAIIVNSGIANACVADGAENAEKMCLYAANALGVSADDVVVGSTGIIGQSLPMDAIKSGTDALARAGLTARGHAAAAEAIMTTDTIVKEVAARFALGGKTVVIGGMAKGCGMVHPDMATVLCFVTTDAAISSKLLQKAIGDTIKTTFNMVSVDRDTSTNDTAVLMASGLAGNVEITEQNGDYKIFVNALYEVLERLAKMLAKDGEGATKLIECTVSGAKRYADARKTAKAVICSNLVKAAMFGADANWGRVLCAAGYSGANIDVTRLGVKFQSAAGEIEVCKNGAGLDFSEELAAKILKEAEIKIIVTLEGGKASATAWGCDLTYDYVKINGEYRS